MMVRHERKGVMRFPWISDDQDRTDVGHLPSFITHSAVTRTVDIGVIGALDVPF